MAAMNRRDFLARAILTAAAVAPALAACGGPAPPKTIKVVIAEYSKDHTRPFWQALADQYSKQSGVKVDLQVVDWNSIDQQVSTMIQNSQPPDVLNLNAFASYAKDGLLYSGDEVLSPKTREDFLPPFARERRHNRVQKISRSVAVHGGDRDRIAEAEPVELIRGGVVLRVVDLVGDHDDRLVRAAEDRRDFLVARRHAKPCVHDEEDEVGLLDRSLRLLRDVACEGRRISHVDAPSVDEDEALPRPLAHDLLTVARHPGSLEDDRLAGRGQPVDERGLADVREADDRDRPQEGSGHPALEGTAARCGGTASGRPSACISTRKRQRRRISSWISAVACL